MLQAELFSLLEGTADAAFTVDEHGRICSWNESARKLFGYSAGQVLNRTCGELLGAPAPQVNGHAPAAFDMEVSDQSGRRLWVNISTVIYQDERNARRLVVHLAREVTERKKAEELMLKVLELSRQLVALTSGKGGRTPAAPLSEQERRILRELSRGGNSAEVARDLGIGLQTLRNHLHRINQKLHTHNRLEAVLAAIERRLI
ncbi:MAG: PAS domain S-box protein [Bryobacteraceae bacterium]